MSRNRTCSIGFLRSEHVNERLMLLTHGACLLDISMVECGSYATATTKVTFIWLIDLQALTRAVKLGRL